MAMAQLVGAHFKFGDVRLEHGVAPHVEEHAGVAVAAFLPQHDFCGANVFYEVGFVPSLAYASGGSKIIRRSIITIGETEVRVIDQSHAAEYLNHKWEGGDEQQPRWMRRIAIEMAMQRVYWNGEQT